MIPRPVDFALALGEREVSFTVDADLYPLDAVYGAVHLLLERCYVFLDRPADGAAPDPGRVRVRLRPRGDAPADPAALEAAAGELANELLNQVLRARIGEQQARVREFYLQRAFFAHTPTHSALDAARAERGDAAGASLEDELLALDIPWD